MFQSVYANLAILVATVILIWLLTLQRGLIHKSFENRPIIRAGLEGCLILVMAYALHALFSQLSAAPRLADFRRALVLLADVIVYIGWGGCLGRFIEGLLLYKRATRPDWKLSKLARAVLYGVCFVVSLAIFLVKNSITPAEVFVWTGATAAVLAFVMQQTLTDLFSGLAVSVERPFKLGDWIRLSDGTEGQVIDINWRATHLRTWSKTTFVIPNAKLAKESFINLHGRDHPYAPWYAVKVAGEHAPDRVIALLEEAVASLTYPMPTPAPVVRLMLAEKSPFEYMVWMHFEDYPTMFAGREEFYRAVDTAFRNAGIAIASDIHEVRMAPSSAVPVAPLL